MNILTVFRHFWQFPAISENITSDIFSTVGKFRGSLWCGGTLYSFTCCQTKAVIVVYCRPQTTSIFSLFRRNNGNEAQQGSIFWLDKILKLYLNDGFLTKNHPDFRGVFALCT